LTDYYLSELFHSFIHSILLADRTNGRAYAAVLRLSVCLSFCLSVVCL